MIPHRLLQVAIPSLHISLGVFQKLYDRLEAAAHEVDILRTTEESLSEMDDSPQTRKTYDEHISRVREANHLKHEAEEKRLAAHKMAELANWLHLSTQQTVEETPPLVAQLYDQEKHLNLKADQLVSI